MSPKSIGITGFPPVPAKIKTPALVTHISLQLGEYPAFSLQLASFRGLAPTSPLERLKYSAPTWGGGLSPDVWDDIALCP